MTTQVFRNSLLALALLVTTGMWPAAYAGQRPILAFPAASAHAGDQKRVDTESFARTELFFGTAKPDGTAVTDEEWRVFLDEEVTPRFPDGLTVLTGVGQFRDSSGTIIQERSVVLVLLYPIETRKSSGKKIEQIREAYKEAFQQQSVLRVDDSRPARISF